MAIYYGFMGGPEGDIPEYTQPQFAAVLAKLFSNGVTADFENEFAVSENDPVSLSVIVPSGWAWIEGFWVYNTEDLVKTLGAADPDHDRIDRIVLRLDTTEEFKISSEVLEGTPAADPDPPELTQTAAIYEISLAQVLVAEDATSVSDEDITDEREFAVVPNTVDLTSVQTLTNKRITKKVSTLASTATLTINSDSCDEYYLTAQAEALEIAAPTGTPTAGQSLIIGIKDNGTTRALTWNAAFVEIGCTLPTDTTEGKNHIIGCKWNAANSKWWVLAVGEEA